MRAHSLLRKGFEHITFCEDFLIIHETNNFFFGIVFDGCSSGTDSHFASSLFGKLFKKEIHGMNEMIDDEARSYMDDIEENISKIIFRHFVSQLSWIKNDLHLQTDELLSTIGFLIYNKKTKAAQITTVGDGSFVINGEYISIDQNNMPLYISYYLDPKLEVNSERYNIINPSDFDVWWDDVPKKTKIEKVKDITISTDGLDSFLSSSPIEKTLEPIDYLTQNMDFVNNKIMLQRKYNLLKDDGWRNMDDLGIIRLVIENE